MKKSKLFTAGFLAVIAMVFASCSSIDIVKRRYTDGFYVHINKKAPTAGSEQANEKIKPEPVSASESDNNISADISSIPSILSEVAGSTAAFTKTSSAKATGSSISNHAFFVTTNGENETRTSRFEKKMMKLERKPEKTNYQLSRGDTPTIVLILLCLFLPFIAVGIVDDWGTRFLISILLTLLFFLPGVIYAFIVCFG